MGIKMGFQFFLGPGQTPEGGSVVFSKFKDYLKNHSKAKPAAIYGRYYPYNIKDKVHNMPALGKNEYTVSDFTRSYILKAKSYEQAASMWFVAWFMNGDTILLEEFPAIEVSKEELASCKVSDGNTTKYFRINYWDRLDASEVDMYMR